jgi:hypothetical protein
MTFRTHVRCTDIPFKQISSYKINLYVIKTYDLEYIKVCNLYLIRVSCHSLQELYAGFVLVIGFIKHSQKVTTNNYDNLTELHTQKITVITAHLKSSQSSEPLLGSGFQQGKFLCLSFSELPPPQLTASHSNNLRLNLNSSLIHSLTDQQLFTSLSSTELTSLHYMSCLQHLGPYRTESTVSLLLFTALCLVMTIA